MSARPFKRKRERLTDEDRSPKLGLKYKDLAVLDQLIKHGADLDEPRHALYFLYFPTMAQAEAAAQEASARGWLTDVREPSGGIDTWSLKCESYGVVLEPQFVRETTDYFEALAQRHDGEYDGWEAST